MVVAFDRLWRNTVSQFLALSMDKRVLLASALALLFFAPGFAILGLLVFAFWHKRSFTHFQRLDRLDRWLVVQLLLLPVYLFMIYISVTVVFVFPPLVFVLAPIGALGLNVVLWLTVFRLCKAFVALFNIDHWAVTGLVTLLIMAAIPAVSNSILSQRIADLQKMDKPFFSTRAAKGKFAIASNNRSTTCAELCMRLLIGTKSQTVIQANITGRSEYETRQLDKMQATTFFRSSAEQCPRLFLDSGSPKYAFENDQFSPGKGAVASLMRVSIARDGCIEQKKSVLGDAAQVVLIQKIGRHTNRPISSLNPMRLVVQGERIGYLENDQGSLRWRYRATRVRSRPMAPLLFISFGQGRHNMFPAPTILRLQENVFEPNNGAKFYSVETLFSKKLMLDLSLDGSERLVQQKETIENLLNLQAAFTPAREKILEDWFKQIDKQAILTNEQKEMALAIYRQTAIRLPLHATRLILKAAGSDREFAGRIVDLLMQRFDLITRRYSALQPGEWVNKSERRLMSSIDVNLKSVPDNLMRPHLDKIVAVLDRPPHAAQHRSWGRTLKYSIQRLALLPEDRLPLVLEKRKTIGARQFRRLLCELGPRADGLRAEAEKVLFKYKYSNTSGKIGINTLHILIAMGSDPEKIWPRYKNTSRKRLKMSRETFDSHVAFVQGMNPYRCVFR